MRRTGTSHDLVKAATDLAKRAPFALRGDRVSDADRERAVDRLNDSLLDGRLTLPEFEERFDAVSNAVYKGDLRAPLAGLPDPMSSDAEIHVLRAGAAGLKRDGAWTVPARLEVRAAMGSVVLDFTEAKIEHRVLQIEIRLGTGSAELIVPAGATADVDGLVASTGSINNNVASQPVRGAPHFVVRGRAWLGSVTVRHPRTRRRFGF